MGNKKIDRTKKTLAILLAVCFVLSVTAASVSAADNSEYKNKDGYNAGYDKGHNEGEKQGKADCKQYGIKEILQKIPSPLTIDSWTKYYEENYNKGYKNGYLDGYSPNRYTCLKKE